MWYHLKNDKRRSMVDIAYSSLFWERFRYKVSCHSFETGIAPYMLKILRYSSSSPWTHKLTNSQS